MARAARAGAPLPRVRGEPLGGGRVPGTRVVSLDAASEIAAPRGHGASTLLAPLRQQVAAQAAGESRVTRGRRVEKLRAPARERAQVGAPRHVASVAAQQPRGRERRLARAAGPGRPVAHVAKSGQAQEVALELLHAREGAWAQKGEGTRVSAASRRLVEQFDDVPNGALPFCHLDGRPTAQPVLLREGPRQRRRVLVAREAVVEKELGGRRHLRGRIAERPGQHGRERHDEEQEGGAREQADRAGEEELDERMVGAAAMRRGGCPLPRGLRLAHPLLRGEGEGGLAAHDGRRVGEVATARLALRGEALRLAGARLRAAGD